MRAFAWLGSLAMDDACSRVVEAPSACPACQTRRQSGDRADCSLVLRREGYGVTVGLRRGLGTCPATERSERSLIFSCGVAPLASAPNTDSSFLVRLAPVSLSTRSRASSMEESVSCGN